MAYTMILMMVFCGLLPILMVYSSEGFLKSARIEEIPFEWISKKPQKERSVFAMGNFEERRNFFHLFNVPYIICYFAAKGKWPFIPPVMQIKVDQVSRSIFPQNDGFIQKYCRNWIAVKQCHRPTEYIVLTPAPTAPTIIEVETDPPEPPTTPCSCAPAAYKLDPTQPIVYFDRNHIGNVSSETILNTIDFLQSFLQTPEPTKKPKKKTRIRINVRH